MKVDGYLFADEVHYNFFLTRCEQFKAKPRLLDTYSLSLFYLLALCGETRRHFDDLFDMQEGGIKPEGLGRGWQTGSTRKLTRLAFNLWNGCCSDETEIEPGASSSFYAVDEIFCCSFQQYFFEAVRLRFPEYHPA